MLNHQYRTGWLKQKEAVSRKDYRFRRLLVPTPVMPKANLPASFCLLNHRNFPFDQGCTNTSYANSGTQLVQIMTEAQFASGQPYQPVELSRRFTAYYATQVLDPTMNPDDGGTISATLTALSNAQPGGMGVCREVTWRWHCGADESYNRQVLAECPFSLAIQDASPDRICQIAEAPWGTPSVWQALIANGHPIHIGIDWPANWDEGSTFVDSIGEIVGSHALIIIGWFTDPSGVLYWMLDNSHGPIYAPHPVPFAGYDLLRHPAYAFFVSDQVLGRLMKPGSGAESMVACGVTGFIVRPQLLTFAQAFAR